MIRSDILTTDRDRSARWCATSEWATDGAPSCKSYSEVPTPTTTERKTDVREYSGARGW